MKRKIKRIASFVLAAVMVFAMAVPAMAASITMSGDNVTGHTYNVYQIFTGDVAQSETDAIGDVAGETLSNVKYGKNYVPTDKRVGDPVEQDTLEDLEEMTGNALAADFLKSDDVDGKYYITGPDTPYGTLPKDGSYKLDVEPGYYIIQDVTEDAVVYSAYIVEVVDGDVTITPKATNIPKFEKKVKEKNDSTGAPETDWQDGADYDLDDLVPFKLEATLPGPQDQFDRYDTYKLVFHDEMSTGLTLDEGSIEVFKNDGTSDTQIPKGNYSVVTEGLSDGCTFEVTITDVKAAPISAKSGDKIRVEFDAKLNENAVIGEAGNPNTGHLEYSNNPDTDGTGETPDDTVKVYTFEVNVKKVDEDGTEPLEGAGFTLYKWVSDEREGTPNETPDWVDTTTTPAGGAAVGHWAKVKDITPTAENKPTEFEFKDLDSGIYKLVETTTPDGYNTYAPVDFTITATYSNLTDDPEGPTLSVNITSTSADEFVENPEGTFTITIKNQKGATLPETGGIGTTIFYVVGSVLVLGAVILLVTKRRMKSE